MTIMQSLSAAAALCALMVLPGAAAEIRSPVVVELFTSQGCSSCPPADAYLGELAKEPDLIALSYHVDYWDYIGWKDPFALPEATARQRRYTETLGARYLYTPEMVIDGRADAAGSDRSKVGGLIRAGRQAGGKIPFEITEPSKDNYRIRIPTTSFHGGATLWMALFDRRHRTTVARGENGGRTLNDFNVVRELRALGRYDGAVLDVPVEMVLDAQNGCALLLQADHRPGDGQGAMLGAALVSED